MATVEELQTQLVEEVDAHNEVLEQVEKLKGELQQRRGRVGLLEEQLRAAVAAQEAEAPQDEAEPETNE